MKVCCVFSNEYIQHNMFNIKTKNHPKLFQGTQERVRNSRSERAISVRATEGLLNYYYYCYYFIIISSSVVFILSLRLLRV